MALHPNPNYQSKHYTGKPISLELWENIFGNWGKELTAGMRPKITAKGKSEDYAVIEAYEYKNGKASLEEVFEEPGVKLVVELDTAITNPAQFIKKTAEQSIKQVFYPKDLDSGMQQDIWKKILSGESTGIAGEEYFKRIVQGKDQVNLSLKDIPVTKKVISTFYVGKANGKFEKVEEESQEGIYGHLANTYTSAITGMASKENRNAAMRKWQAETLGDLSEELQQKIRAGKLRADSPEVKLILAQNKIANSMGSISSDISKVASGASSLRMITSPLASDKVKAKAKWQMTDTTRSTLQQVTDGKLTLADAIKQGLLDAESNVVQAYAAQQKLTATIAASQKELKDLAAQFKGTQYATQFEKATREHARYLENLSKKVNGVKVEDFGTGQYVIYGGSLKAYLHDLENANFEGGIRDRFLNRTHDVLSCNNVKIRQILDSTEGAPTINRLSRVLRTRYRSGALDDLNDDIAEGAGGVFNTFVLSKYQHRLAIFGPPKILKDFLVKTHYFGLNYEEDGDEKYARLVPLHKFNLDVLGDIVKVTGGSHFAGSIELYKLLATGQLNGLRIKTEGKDFNPIANFSSIAHGKDLLSLLNGKAIDGLKLTDVKGFQGKVGGFRKWVLDNASKLGITLKNGEIESTLENSNRLISIINQTTRREFDHTLLNATQMRVGLLERYTSFLGQGQAKMYQLLNAVGIGKYVKSYTYYKEAIAVAISSFLKAAAGTVSGGTAAVFLNWVFDYIGHTVVKMGEGFIKALNPLVEGDFGTVFKNIERTIDGAVDIVIKVFMIPLGIIFVFSFLYVSSIFSLVNPADPARATTFKELDLGGSYPIPPNIEACIGDADDGGLAELSGGGGVADEAKSIASGLLRGFWCFWNHHPSYDPEFWNQAVFDANPSPGSDFSCGNCLFWCTALPIKAYDGAIPGDLLNSQSMAEFFGYQNDDVTSTSADGTRVFIANNAAGMEVYQPQPGDVIFFRTPLRQYYRIAHVAMVYSYQAGVAMESVHSNSYYKRFTYTVNGDGVVQDYAIGGDTVQEVIGFGRFL